jgi:hypothetical protein
MKTYKNLYPQICAFENLYGSFKAAARGKRGNPRVAEFEQRLEDNLIQLQDELVAQTYQPGAYTHFRITTPKPRIISAAPFRDRVAHHALCRLIEPIWERKFIHDSYACRVGKGTHAALDRCTEFARRYPYVLKCDLVHFFPSVDHAILREILARPIADAQTRWLMDQFLDSGKTSELSQSSEVSYFPGDDLFAALRPRGLPIGNLTSQFWANVYLNELDQFVKRELKCRAYLRYCDDFLLFHDEKPPLWAWRTAIIEFARTLRLKLHERESTVLPVRTGIPFLGFRVYPDHRRLKRANGVAFARRFAARIQAYQAGRLTRAKLDATVLGWVAHTTHGDTYGLRRTLLWERAIELRRGDGQAQDPPLPFRDR